MKRKKIKIIFICYHYLKRNDEFKRIWGNDFKQFKEHINFFNKEYKPINIYELSTFLKGEDIDLPRKCSLLSFDDSLKEHANIINPYLNKYNIKALFNISTCIFDNKPLNPQVLHFGTAYYGIRKFYKLVEKHFNVTGLDWGKYTIKSNNNLDNFYNEFKVSLKYNLSYSALRALLLEIWNKELLKDIPDIMDKVYISKKDLHELVNDGHTIGLHSRNHALINDDSFNNLFKTEIQEAKQELESIINKKINCFSYPYAHPEDVLNNLDYIKAIRSLGIDYIFTVFKKENKFDPNYIGRYTSQSSDNVKKLKNKIWEYEISNHNK